MRAPLLVGVLAVALAATACSSAPDPSPLPSSVADGLITDITNPEAPFPVAWTAAVGDDGSAVVFFLSEPPGLLDLDPPPVGIALVYRDGMYDVIVDPRDPRFSSEWPGFAAVSDSTVVWNYTPIDCASSDCPVSIRFWDRESKQGSDSITFVTEGEMAGEEISRLDTVLLGDVLYWVQLNTASDEFQQVVLAATADGRVWTALDLERSWFRMGRDMCASSQGRPVIWLLEQEFLEDTSEFTILQATSDGQGNLHLIEDSTISFDRLIGDSPDVLAERCGNDVLELVRERAQNGIIDQDDYQAVVVSADDPEQLSFLSLDPRKSRIGGRSMTSTWIAFDRGVLYGESGWCTLSS